MRIGPFTLVLVSLVAAALVACSGDDSNEPQLQPTSPPPTSEPAATVTATPAAMRLSDLTLVYVDSSKGQGAEVYVSAYDGANPRKLTTLPLGTRAAGVAGGLLATVSQREISLVDLKTGAVRNVQTAGSARDVRFVNTETLVYTTNAGCGPPGDSKTALTKVGTANLQQTELASPDNRTISIAGSDAATGQVALTLRGCDVGVDNIGVYSLADGKLVSTITTKGCGWAAAALAFKRALVSWQFCSGVPDKANVDVSLLDISVTPPKSTDLKAPAGGANLHEFKLRPGQAQAALGTQMPGTPGPGFKPTPTGLWLLDLNSGTFSNIAASDGLEQYPVGWSPDGRHLLAATVRAMGLCDYAAIDVSTRQTTPFSKSITFCGANGDVLGWTVVR